MDVMRVGAKSLFPDASSGTKLLQEGVQVLGRKPLVSDTRFVAEARMYGLVGTEDQRFVAAMQEPRRAKLSDAASAASGQAMTLSRTFADQRPVETPEVTTVPKRP
jgi:hypothetical protein